MHPRGFLAAGLFQVSDAHLSKVRLSRKELQPIKEAHDRSMANAQSMGMAKLSLSEDWKLGLAVLGGEAGGPRPR